LEQKSCYQEDEQSELKVNVETIRMNFFMTKKQVQVNKEKIRDIQEVLDKLKNQTAPV
jgi:hypothetical protein